MSDANEADPWDLDAQERDRRRRWAATTPSERLHWLERAMRFAAAAGALPASGRRGDRGSIQEPSEETRAIVPDESGPAPFA